MRYFLGIILLGVGFVIVWKSDWIMDNFGRIAWAEEKLGMEGGTRLFYKLIGIVVIIGAFMYMFGFFEPILYAIFKNSIQTLE